MKTNYLKFQIVSLAVLFVLGTSSLVNVVSVLPVTSHPLASEFKLSRNFPNQNLSNPKVRQVQDPATTTSLPTNTQGSKNWAGYIVTPATNNSNTSVSGSWTVPTITASQSNAVAAQWIGLGGVSSDDLLQMGTIEQIENGQPVAELFWEQLPSPAQNVMTVPIGSTISANISPSSTSSLTWNLTFTINGQVTTQTIPSVTLDSSYVQGIGTSAEWINEDPSNENDQLYPLANMGTVSFQSAMVNGQPINFTGNKVQPVALLSSNGNVLLAPSALGTDGMSFSTKVVSTNSTTRPTLRYSLTRNPRNHLNLSQGRVSITFGGSAGEHWTIQMPKK